MRSALEWVMASRVRAIILLLALSLLPLVGLVAAALVALVVLRRGFVEGLTVGGAAGAGLLAVHLAAGAPVVAVVGTVIIGWLPVAVLAAVLKSTGSQARVLAFAGLLGCGAVAGIFVATGDPAPLWETLLRDQVLPFFEGAGIRFGDPDALDAAIPRMAGLMTGLAAAMWAIGHYLAVALGRWAQAAMVNPGGFRAEFHALRLGRTAALASGAVFIAATLVDQPVLANAALVLVLMYAMQGLAVMHGVVGRAKLHWAWLVPPYALAIVLAPHMVALMAVMGFADRWVDFRGRIAEAG